MSKKIHAQFVEIASTVSQKLSTAIADVGPLPLRKRQDVPLVERLCQVIAGQQLSTKAASTIWGRVVDHAGNDSLTKHLALVDVETLRGCGLSYSKAKAMKAIIAANREGILDVDQLATVNHAERSIRLTSIWGVGQWTADMIGLSYFGDKDIWPGGDVTVWKTLQRLTDKRRKMEKTAALFAPHRSYLALYMYRIADGQ